MAEESWIKRAEVGVLFGNRGKGAEAARLLEVSATNKTIANRDQAVLLQAARVLETMYQGLYPNDKTKYGWVTSIINGLEITQQTMAGEGNSRVQFMKVAIEQARGAYNKAKGFIEDVANK